MQKKHLVFYDGQCGLCDHVVQFLIKHDKDRIFVFAPLQGSTAKVVLKDHPSFLEQMDTLVLIENYGTDQQQIYVLGKGTFRILWLLGGFWKVIGWLSFLPSQIYDWGYRLVARNRGYFFRDKSCIVPDKDRFLP